MILSPLFFHKGGYSSIKDSTNMSDIFCKEKRSSVMKAVKSRNTKTTELKMIEIFKELHVIGWRRTYPLIGKPDFVFPKKRIVVFVDGCFWHGHKGCKYFVWPKSNVDFWKEKINQNIIRDNNKITQLEEAGWRVLIVWECELKKSTLNAKLDMLEKEILGLLGDQKERKYGNCNRTLLKICIFRYPI